MINKIAQNIRINDPNRPLKPSKSRSVAAAVTVKDCHKPLYRQLTCTIHRRLDRSISAFCKERILETHKCCKTMWGVKKR